MPRVTIDESGQYLPEPRRDKTKGKPEAVPVEERNLPVGDVALSVRNDQQNEDEEMSEVRGTDEPGEDFLNRQHAALKGRPLASCLSYMEAT